MDRQGTIVYLYELSQLHVAELHDIIQDSASLKLSNIK